LSPINIIDLFAGPGGLGEGFSAFSPEKEKFPFRIKLSVEKETSAHKTLELRAFFRQFKGEAPDEYYQYLRGEIGRGDLFDSYPLQSVAAKQETLGGPMVLGNEDDDKLIHTRLRQLSKKKGPWVVIGGPPCQAYSLVGRAKNRAIKGYRAEDDLRHFLYKEYLRVLWAIKPEIFVMENVKGILSSKLNGQPMFPKILEDLTHPGKALGKSGGKGYQIYSLVHESVPDLFGSASNDYIIRSEDYGIPQARHRVILLGVRSDIAIKPDKLKLAAHHRVTETVISDCPPLRSGLSKGEDSPKEWQKQVSVAAEKAAEGLLQVGLDKSSISLSTQKSSKLNSRGGRFLSRRRKFRGDQEIANWYLDKNLDGFVNHESRGHIVEDLARYFFCASYAQQSGGVSPRADAFPDSLAPNHANWKSGNFVDRFKVQAANKPSSTITSHISKDGHYFIHPDPSQCRSLTVREAARLQTFPDNYFFEGTRTQQYVQVGNAVPPYLAMQIAEVVNNLLEAHLEQI